ncbi:MAG: DUF2066 domain-containing protein [Pseudomonadota bacterium]|nr:DUF2066 domain-containing protein [Pseudomonadota bacterium]
MLGRWTRNLSLAVSFGLLLIMAPRADAAGLFTVRDIPVDVTAESAAIARERAITGARRTALDLLLRRLTREADWPTLPVPDEEALAGLVASFQVQDEKAAPDRWIARLSFDFDPGGVRRLLKTAGIVFTETRALPMLVLPVLRVAGEDTLWADPNPWLQAWARFDGAERLVPIVAPFGDLDDVLAITAEQALAGDPDALSRLNGRYRTESTMVAHATLVIDRALGTVRLDVALQHYGPDPYPTVVRSFDGAVDQDIVMFMNQAVDRMVFDIGELWKQRTTESFGTEARISVLVPVAGLQDWLEIRRRIDDVSLVRSTDVSMMSASDVVVVLNHVGDTELLRRALAQARLLLDQTDGYWTLRRLDAAGQ